MSKFLVKANKLDIYTNDLVRYYTDDLEHLEFGIVQSYDRDSERLTVSALNKSYPKASNVIERYSEEDWQSMKFLRQSNNYISIQLTPFSGNFIMMSKPTLQNMLIHSLPYEKTLTTSIFTIFDGGLENFLNQVRFTAERIINSTILRYDVNMRDNYIEGRQDKKLLEYYFPHKGTLSKPLVMSMDYDKTSRLKRLILHEIETMINDMVDADIRDSGYIVDDPYAKKTNYKDLTRLRELEFPYVGHTTLRLERFNTTSGMEMKSEVMDAVLNAIDDYLFNYGKVRGKAINISLPTMGSIPMTPDKFNSFPTTNELKAYVVSMIGKYIDYKVVGDEVTTEESLAMYRHLHENVTFPVTFNTQLQLKVDLDSQDPAVTMYEAYNALSNVIDYNLLGMKSTTKELETDLPYQVNRSMSVNELLNSGNQTQFYNNAVGDLEDFINFELLKSTGTISSDLPLKYNMTASVKDMLKNGINFTKVSMIDGASDFIDDDIIQHYQESDELPHIKTERMDTTRTLMNDSSWNFYLDTALYRARKYIDQNQIPKYTYDNGRMEVADIPYNVNKTVSVLDLLQSSNTVNENTTTQDAFDYIMMKSKDFKYFIVLTNKQFVLPLYLTGEPLENVTNSALKETIINSFEDILCWYNANNSTIETKNISHKDIDRVVPFIQSIEVIPDQSNSKNVVFRVFLTDDKITYKAFIMINDRRKFKGIVFSSPHIYSENHIVLKNFDRDEDPMAYNKEDYLRLLLTHNKQAILDCCKA